MRRLSMLVSVVLLTHTVTCFSAMAAEFALAGHEARVLGYISQAVNYGLHDEYDTHEGVNQALTTIFAEGDWTTDLFRVYASGKLNVDWAYQINDGDGAWEDKLFDQSDDLNVDDEYWQLLQEAHVNFSPGNFRFRVGKQIVAWGQTDFIRVLDQINPLDQRRGFSDVEFETSVIPIWLLNSEYIQNSGFGPFQSMRLQFVFNPNADFIPDQTIATGNDAGGIWAPNIEIPLGGPYPMDFMRVGSSPTDISEPDRWDPDGFEYALKLEAIIMEALVTLNGFYGIENSPVTLPSGSTTFSFDPDGRMIAHTPLQGSYPRQNFIGATFTRDLQFMSISALNLGAPVLRLEGLYAFDKEYATEDQLSIIETDEIHWTVGLDWRVKIPLLNPVNTISFSPQFIQRILQDYPDAGIATVEDRNDAFTFVADTNYFNNKLTPSVAYQHDFTYKANFYRLALTYEPNSSWSYTIGALLLDGDEEGKSFEVFDNKDYIWFKIQYQWG